MTAALDVSRFAGACWSCGASLEGKRQHALTCSERCRQRRRRGQRAPRSQRLARRWGLRPTDFWRTPPWLVAAAALELFLAIDVSASAEDSVCVSHIPPGVDGLATSWASEGAAWWNPPYSPGLLPWVEKAAQEHELGVPSMGLVPPATGARYMSIALQRATVVIFLRGRVPFLHPDTGQPGGGNRGDSCLIYFSGRIEEGPARVRVQELSELQDRGVAALTKCQGVPNMFPGSIARELRALCLSGKQKNTCCSSWNATHSIGAALMPPLPCFPPVLGLL